MSTSTRSYSLPLSRWHHVADRIRAFGESKSSAAVSVLDGTIVKNSLSDAQRQALVERGAKAVKDLEQARLAIQTVAFIRTHLAKANADYGVNTLLSQAEGKRKEAALLRTLAGIDLVTKTGIEEVNHTLSDSKNDRDFGYGHSGVRVALVSANTFDNASDAAAILESEASAITDQVADLNRNTLEIVLPIELAQAAGLN